MDEKRIRHAMAADGVGIAYVRYPGASPPFLVVRPARRRSPYGS